MLTGCQTITEKPTSPDQHTEQRDASSLKDAANSGQHVSAPSDLWQVTRDEMQLDLHLENERVQSQLKSFLKHPTYMDRMLNVPRLITSISLTKR